MKPRTVEDAWVLFSDGFDRNTSEMQKSEMKKAFYCGAAALFVMVISNVSEGDEVNPEDMVMMDNLNTELETYMRVIS